MMPKPERRSLAFAFAKHPRGAGCYAKTKTWLPFAQECGYPPPKTAAHLRQTYDHILGKLVRMISNPSPWILPKDRPN